MNQAANAVSIVAAGDVFLDRPDPTSAFAHLSDHLRTFDIAFANVEAPISSRGHLPPWSSKFPLRMAPSMVDGIVAAGFDVVSIANNHTMDYSTDALLDTIELLNAAGIQTVGAGATLAESQQPAILERSGLRIAFLAFQATEHDRPDMRAKHDTPGLNALRLSPYYSSHMVNPHDLAEAGELIKDACTQADAVVVSFHWGRAGSEATIEPQIGLAKLAAESGATLVLGHHTHVLQGLALYGGCPVVFGLGNLVFDWEFPHFVDERILFEGKLTAGATVEARVRPGYSNTAGQPYLVNADDPHSQSIRAELTRLSKELGVELRQSNGLLELPIDG